MSMVIAVATPQIVMIAGDTRVMKQDGTVLSNEFHKVFKVNSNILIGFTGSGDVVNVLNELKYLSRPDDEFADEYANELFDTIAGDKIIEKNANIVILGRAKNGNTHISFFNTSDQEFQEYSNLETGAQVIPFVPEVLGRTSDTELPKLIFSISNMIKRAKSVESFQNEVFKYLKSQIKSFSKLTDTVNSNIETKSIRIK